MFKKITFAVIAVILGITAYALSFTVNGVNYNVDASALTAEVAPGEYNGKTLTNDNFTTVKIGSYTFTVVAIGKDAFKNQTPKFTYGIMNTGNVSYFDEGSFQNAKIGTTNNSYQMNTVVIGSATIDWHPKAFIGNHIRAFNIQNDSRYMTLNETMAIAPTNTHRGIIISKDGTVLYVFPGEQCSSTAYTYTPATSYTLPASVTTIADYAFSGNDRLTSVGLNTNLQTIGEEAFSHTVLTSLTVPANVTTLGPGFIAGNKKITAIGVAAGNTAYKAVDGCVYTIDDATLVAVPASQTTLTIPEGVATIAAKADLDGSLTEVTIPSTVTAIGDEAFIGNPNIASVYCNAVNPPSRGMFDDAVYANATLVLPAGADKAAYEADPDWGKFQNIMQLGGGVPTDPFKVGNLWYQTIDDNTVTIIPNQESDTYSSVQSSWFNQTIVFSGYTFTVTAIADSAFAGATITSIDIPETVTTIGNYAFDGSNLSSLTIPAGVTTLGEGVIARTTGLTSVSVAEGNENYTAIDGCIYNAAGTVLLAAPSGITAVELADNVTETAATAFLGAKSITKVIANPATAPAGGIFEDEVYQNATLWYAPESEASYTGHENWSKFVNVKRFGEFDETPFKDQDGFFWYRQINNTEAIIVRNPNGSTYTQFDPTTTYKSSVTNPDGNVLTVVGIGDHALDGVNYKLTNANGAPTSASAALFAYIPEVPFRQYYDYAFTGLSVPILADHSNFEAVSPKAFYGNKIMVINLYSNPNGYTSVSIDGHIGNLVYNGETLVAVPGNMHGAPGYRETEPLVTAFTIDSSITTIGQYAMGGNTNIKTVTVNAEAIKEGAFEGSALTKFTANENLVSVDSLAFANCTQLNTVNLPSTVTTISDSAFVGCKNITTIKIDAMTPPTGGVFEPEVYENATLVIPEDAEPAYRAAAGWRNFFDTITGDVDNDGVVDVADINLLINIMLHHSEATANSDVNNDGEIDVADINMVVLIMLSE